MADAGTASTLSGAITGVGAWTKCPGALTLSGINTYTGGDDSERRSIASRRDRLVQRAFSLYGQYRRSPEFEPRTHTNVDSTNDAAGYYLQTGGLTLGVDYRVCSCFAIGLTAGYTHTDADLANGGNLDVNGGKLGLYATVFSGGFYADAAVTGG